ALPIAIRDGWIILSKGVLEKCYRQPERGKDWLAFILAHELAHQLNGGLWHMRVFDAREAFRTQSLIAPALLEELRRSADDQSQVLAREVRADQEGIIYMGMAGFDPLAMVSSNGAVTFFAEWVRDLNPGRIMGVARDPE